MAQARHGSEKNTFKKTIAIEAFRCKNNLINDCDTFQSHFVLANGSHGALE